MALFGGGGFAPLPVLEPRSPPPTPAPEAGLAAWFSPCTPLSSFQLPILTPCLPMYLLLSKKKPRKETKAETSKGFALRAGPAPESQICACADVNKTGCFLSNERIHFPQTVNFKGDNDPSQAPQHLSKRSRTHTPGPKDKLCHHECGERASQENLGRAGEQRAGRRTGGRGPAVTGKRTLPESCRRTSQLSSCSS